MKKFSLLVLVILMTAAAGEAQTCLTCYFPPGSPHFCGDTTYDAYATCRVVPEGCSVRYECVGSTGDPCNPKCIPQKWTFGSELPEKAQWVVASVEVTRTDAAAPRKQS